MEIKSGDTIGIIALSGDCEKEKIEQAKANIEALGFNVKLSKNIFDKNRYLAGSDEDKISELHRFFEDDEIKLILCARGGYGAIRLINKIDYNLITLQSGEFTGDIEYLEKSKTYLYTAQCTEDSILFEIDTELFEHFIVNNNNIKDSLKGFYSKIEEKMDILQERIYSIRTNNSAIKKSDYILSKNKFTKNILQGYPLKEDKKVNLKFSTLCIELYSI